MTKPARRLRLHRLHPTISSRLGFRQLRSRQFRVAILWLLLVVGVSAGIFGTGLIPGVSRVQAQESEVSITAIPPRLGEDFSLQVKPGEKLQTSVRVRNGSSKPLLLRTLAQDFIVGENGETPVPLTETTVSNRWSLASWMLLTPSVNEVAPGGSATVNVIIDVPADALPGGHYAMITHQPTTNTETGFDVGAPASASFLQQRVGTLVYVMVEGPINEAAFIRGLTIPKFTEYGPVPFSFKVDNRSDIHLRPQIGVEIYNLFGKKIETIPVETKNVFPFIEREFAGQWDRVWGFGPYTAKVVMSYGSQGQIAIAKTRFWLLPITLVLALLIVLLVIAVILLLIRRHLNHRRENQQAQIQKLQTRVRELEEQHYEQFDT